MTDCQHQWAEAEAEGQSVTQSILCRRVAPSSVRTVWVVVAIVVFGVFFVAGLLSGCASRPAPWQPDPLPESQGGGERVETTRERGSSHWQSAPQTQPGREIDDPPEVDEVPTWRDEARETLDAAVERLLDDGRSIPAGVIVVLRWLRGEIDGTVSEAWALLRAGLSELGPSPARLRELIHEVLVELGRRRTES